MEGKIQETNHFYNGVVRFLAMLEEEVYSATSPIWDTEFMHNNTSLPLSPTLGMVLHIAQVLYRRQTTMPCKGTSLLMTSFVEQAGGILIKM